ncbi:hypothetical protein DPX16_10089 [Anabarilius grahami]|uniref:Uncharacterized protein n=1 Tax=Anabarilius grahami TaxID=495550 RepID=A0A3N0XX09_ANAGA|nr:hypothetical protein DPX16_10089 [Anabarilius grahami]
MPLHQISVIPRDVTSSRVSSSGKAKEKDKQMSAPSRTAATPPRPRSTASGHPGLRPTFHKAPVPPPRAASRDQLGGISPLGKESTAHLPVADNSSSVSQWKETLIPTALDSAPAAIADAVLLNDPKLTSVRNISTRLRAPSHHFEKALMIVSESGSERN